ncbi:MAG: 4Fe-4S dicluster domain-containing protein [Chloroflexi bacterium]|nr:4Fe-4S dicluster domain-containing protein [Chloroflexota bacterium]
MPVETPNTLAQTIAHELNENVYLCYQCVKCTSGCPLADEFDLAPNQVMRALQLGEDDRVLHSKTIWLCASCQTCLTRCPQNIDLPRINDQLSMEAKKRGVKSAAPEIGLFRQVFLRNARILGRAYELGLILEMNLRTRQPFKDVPMGLQMVLKRKVSIFPHFARPPKRAKPAAQKENRIAYYPGCSLHSLSSELDHSTKAVFAELDVELYEPKGWTCCGSSPAHSSDHLLATTMPMKNLALIEQSGFREAVAPCTACYARFKTAQYDVSKDPELKKQVDDKIGYTYQNQVVVKSLLDVFDERVGLDAIARRVRKPLKDLKVASYYGCLLTRPPKVTHSDHPEYPMQMDRVVEKLGATPIDWSFKTECCGGSLSLTRTDIVLNLTRKIIDNARAVGADIITTSCPLCHVNLDTRQAALKLEQPMPVLFITQLMGLAFGLEPHALAVDKHMVDARQATGLQRFWKVGAHKSF